MNSTSDHSHPLLQSLADEAAGLPARAAREARQTKATRRRQRRHFTLAVTALCAGLGVSSVFTSQNGHRAAVAVPPETMQPLLVLAPPQPVPTPESFAPKPNEFVKVQSEEEALREPLPLPEGLNKEQQDLVTASRGLPLLLVKDSSGKVTRIHVIER